MPIVVTKDGTEIDFPDDLSNEEITQVLQKRFAPKPKLGRVGEFIQAPDIEVPGPDVETAAGATLARMGITPPKAPTFAESALSAALPIPDVPAPQGGMTQADVARLTGVSPTPQNQATLALLGGPDTQSAQEVLTALANQGIGLANFFQSPAGTMTAGMGELGPAAQRLLAAGWGVEMGRHVPEAAQRLGEASVTGTPFQQKEAAAGLLGNILLLAAGGAALARPIRSGFEALTPPEPQGPLPTGAVLEMPPRATPSPRPRLPKPEVPEGPLTAPEPEAAPAPPAPKELSSWDDFVSYLSANGTGRETRAQIKEMFRQQVPDMSNQAAANLAREAFGPEWLPGGQAVQKGPSAPEARQVEENVGRELPRDVEGGTPAQTGDGGGLRPATQEQPPEVGNLGVWSQEQWGVEALKKTPIEVRQQMARYAGLRHPDGTLRTGPNDLAKYGQERFAQMAEAAQRPSAAATTSPVTPAAPLEPLPPTPPAEAPPPLPAEMQRALDKQRAAVQAGQAGPYPEIEADAAAWTKNALALRAGMKAGQPDMSLWQGQEVYKNKYKQEQAGPKPPEPAPAPQPAAATLETPPAPTPEPVETPPAPAAKPTGAGEELHPLMKAAVEQQPPQDQLPVIEDQQPQEPGYFKVGGGYTFYSNGFEIHGDITEVGNGYIVLKADNGKYLKVVSPPKPLTEITQTPYPDKFNSIKELIDFRNKRRAEEVALYQEQIGLSKEQAETLQQLLADGRSTSKFEKKLTPELRDRLNKFFEESPLNQKDSPFQFWDFDKNYNPEELVGEDDPKYLSSALFSAIADKVPESPTSDKFIYAAVAARKLRELGLDQRDLSKLLDEHSKRAGGNEEYFKLIAGRLKTFLDRQGIQFPETKRAALPTAGHPIVTEEGGGIGIKATTEPVAPAETPATQPPESKLPETLSDAFEQYDDTGEIQTPGDLVDTVDRMIGEGKAPESLQSAVDQYRDTIEESYREWGGRGGLEEDAENRFLRALKKEISKQKPKKGKTAPGATPGQIPQPSAGPPAAKTEGQAQVGAPLPPRTEGAPPSPATAEPTVKPAETPVGWAPYVKELSAEDQTKYARMREVISQQKANETQIDALRTQREQAKDDFDQQTQLSGQISNLLLQNEELSKEQARLHNDLFDKVWAIETAPFRGRPPEAGSPPKVTNKVIGAQHDNLLDQVNEALKDAPTEGEAKILFSVPGDGDFNISNNQTALKAFKKIVEERFPKTAGTVATPGSGNKKGRAMPKAVAPDAAALPKLGASAVSSDKSRYSILTGYADGTQIVSTDGRQLLRIVSDDAPGTPAKPVRLDKKGKETTSESNYPDFNQVISPSPELLKGGVDSAQLWNLVNQADKIWNNLGDKETPSVELFINPDGSLGMSSKREATGDEYASNVQAGALNAGSYNPDYLFNAADVARRLGNSKVDLYAHGQNGPLEVRGKNSQHLVMPMGGEDSVRSKLSNFTPGPAEHGSLPLGYGPLKDPDSPLISGSVGKFGLKLEAGKFTTRQYFEPNRRTGSAGRWEEYGAIPLDKFEKGSTANRKAMLTEAFGKKDVTKQQIADLEKEAGKLIRERNDIVAEGKARLDATKVKGAKVKITTPEPPPGSSAAKSFFGPMADSLTNPLGSIDPTTVPGYDLYRELTAPLRSLGEGLRRFWSGFAMEAVPTLTRADRETGEAGARLAVAKQVARNKGLIFADKVLEGSTDPLINERLGGALTEDNLRGVREKLLEQAESIDMEEPGAEERVADLLDQAQRVQTIIGQEGSPFRTEADYQRFLRSTPAQLAIERHKQLWQEQKDPLFRKANDLDPDTELETRGSQTGARINLKAVQPGETSPTAIGPARRRTLIRQTATLLRRDPFAKPAKGTAQSYEGSYRELMAHGFEREYPVAAQHEFINRLIESGNGRISAREFIPDLLINGEKTEARLMRLRAWRGNFLHIPKSLVPEYDAVSGLTPSARIPIFTPVANFLTQQSIKGIAEGSAHAGNLFMELFTGVGPTGNPLFNTLVKSIGLGPAMRLPGVVIKAFGDRRGEMMQLLEIGAAKEPYKGGLGLSWLINKIDQGSRLYAADVYRKLAANGWVPDTETGLREFVNNGAGQYNKALQPQLIRWLRDTGVQPFATAMQTFAAQGVRNLAMAPAAKGTSPAAALALRADKAAGAIGFIVTVTALNYLVSGKPTGPNGTPLGSVGWVGQDGRLHTYNVAKLMGWDRGARLTGLQAAVEAKRSGLSDNTAAKRAVGAIGNYGLSYVTGPAVRAGTIAVTGSRPGVPMVQEAPVAPPTTSSDPMKTQIASNIKTALREANPLVDAVVSAAQGKPYQDIAQRQLNKYMPHTGSSERTIENLPRIVQMSEAKDYAQYLIKEGRKLPVSQRSKWLNERFKADGVSDQVRGRVLIDLRRSGFYLP